MRQSSGKKIEVKTSTDGSKMRLTSKNTKADKEQQRQKIQIKQTTFDDMKCNILEIFQTCIDRLIEILAFRAGDYEFDIQNQQRLKDLIKQFKIIEINQDICFIEYKNNKIIKQITVINIQGNSIDFDVDKNVIFIIPSTKSKKILKDVVGAGDYEHSYFYQYELLTSRFNYDEENMENIYCIHYLKKHKIGEQGVSGMKADCLKDINPDDIFSRISELKKGEYLDFKFMYDDGLCQELRSIK